MTHKQLARELAFLYDDYCNALVEAEKAGKGKYTDEDFNNFGQFMRYINNNHLW